MAFPNYPTTYVNSKGKTVDFPRPAKPIGESSKVNNLIISFDSGAEQRRKKGDSRMTFELTYPLLEKAACDDLKAFFRAAGGNLLSFQWTHPVSKVAYTVRFDMDQLVTEYHMTTGQSVHYFKTQLKLVQVL